MLYVVLNLFLGIKNVLVLWIFFIILILIFVCFYFLSLRKKLTSPTKYISIVSLIILCVAYFMVLFIHPGFPLKTLKIGGNIPIKLSISKKYIKNFNINKYIKQRNIISNNIKISLCNINSKKTKKDNNTWINFLLFLKTPNSYYVDCGKLSNIILIPKKYVYSEVFKK